MSEEQYNDSLYCNNCGEDENLAFDSNYAGWHRYICRECGSPFRIKEIDKE